MLKTKLKKLLGINCPIVRLKIKLTDTKTCCSWNLLFLKFRPYFRSNYLWSSFEFKIWTENEIKFTKNWNPAPKLTPKMIKQKSSMMETSIFISVSSFSDHFLFLSDPFFVMENKSQSRSNKLSRKKNQLLKDCQKKMMRIYGSDFKLES